MSILEKCAVCLLTFSFVTLIPGAKVNANTCHSILSQSSVSPGIRTSNHANSFIRQIGSAYFENDLIIMHSGVSIYFYYKGRLLQGSQRLSLGAVRFEQYEGLPKYSGNAYLTVAIDPYLIDDEDPDRVIKEAFDQYENGALTFTCIRGACHFLNQILSKDQVSAWTMEGFLQEIQRLVASDGSRLALPHFVDREYMNFDDYLNDVRRQQARWVVEKSFVSGIHAALFFGAAYGANEWIITPLIQSLN